MSYWIKKIKVNQLRTFCHTPLYLIRLYNVSSTHIHHHTNNNLRYKSTSSNILLPKFYVTLCYLRIAESLNKNHPPVNIELWINIKKNENVMQSVIITKDMTRQRFIYFCHFVSNICSSSLFPPPPIPLAVKT